MRQVVIFSFLFLTGCATYVPEPVLFAGAPVPKECQNTEYRNLNPMPEMQEGQSVEQWAATLGEAQRRNNQRYRYLKRRKALCARYAQG